jgi:hypothetical protein
MKKPKQISKTKQKKKAKSDPRRVVRDLKDLGKDELSGDTHSTISTATSSTDEDEDEGLGDGNIGRSRDDPFSK